MFIVVLLVSFFVSVEHAWKACLLCLAISIELVLCIRVFEAPSSYIHHFGSLPLTVILEAGLLTAAYLFGRGLRWLFVRERPFPKSISMVSEWRDSSLIRPLLYVVLTALGTTLFALTCLNIPEGRHWDISYPFISWAIACLGVLLTWVVIYGRLVKGRLFTGIASVFVGIFIKGFSMFFLGNYVAGVTPSRATGVVQIKAAKPETGRPIGATGADGRVGRSDCKGHFSTTRDLPVYDGATVIDSDWATVGSNYEVWQVDSGTWVEQGYNIQGAPGNPGASGFSAITSASFTIPSIGSPVSIAATIPWADVGDTISVTDGAHQLQGRVLANTGSVLSVLNSGYAGNTTGIVAAGSPISLSAPTGDISELLYGFDDFLCFDAPTDGATTWLYVGTNELSPSHFQHGHAGIVSFPSGTTNSVNELIANQGSDLGSPAFTNVQKCVVRWVVFCDGAYSSSSFDGEWYVGLGNPDGSGAMYGGALLSFAPGFPAAGLLAGSYTSISKFTETPTGFTIAPNTWYDIIVSWTPTAIKYYAAVYGETPRLIATNTTNISTIPQFPLAGNNRYKDGSHSVTLFIDKVEWLYQISGNNPMALRFMQPRKCCSCFLASNRLSRMCMIRSIHSPFESLTSKLSFIVGTLCPSTNLIPVFSQSGDATASAGCSLCIRNSSAFLGTIPVSTLCHTLKPRNRSSISPALDIRQSLTKTFDHN